MYFENRPVWTALWNSTGLNFSTECEPLLTLKAVLREFGISDIFNVAQMQCYLITQLLTSLYSTNQTWLCIWMYWRTKHLDDSDLMQIIKVSPFFFFLILFLSATDFESLKGLLALIQLNVPVLFRSARAFIHYWSDIKWQRVHPFTCTSENKQAPHI